MREVYHRFVALLERAFGSGGILAYHGVGKVSFAPQMHVPADVLRRQLLQLRDRYEFVPLVELVERLRRGRSVLGCISVTFDDAYSGVCRYGAPVLRELDIPATIFVCSDAAREGDVFWWDVVERIRVNCDKDRWERLRDLLGLGTLRMDDPQAPDKVRRRIMIQWSGRGQELCERLDGGERKASDPWRSSTLSELEAVASDERLDFACHTISHPVLPFLPPEEQKSEITEAYEWLRARLPRVRPFLAYPYGRYNRETAEIAAQCGMEAGFTTEPRTPARTEFPMYIPRLCVKESTEKDEVLRSLARAHRLPRILVRGRHPRLPTPEDTTQRRR